MKVFVLGLKKGDFVVILGKHVIVLELLVELVKVLETWTHLILIGGI